MNNAPLFLFFLSAFTMNLVLQCALGIKGIVESKNTANMLFYIKLGTIFVAVILLWVIIYGVKSIIPGMYIFVLLFPVSYMVYNGIEFLIFRFVLKKDSKDDNSIDFPGGICAVIVFICVNLAGNFAQVSLLSFGFCTGILIIFIILEEIRKRAALEAVPCFLRGKPLVLVAMGLLSLVFTTASLLFFRMVGAG
jgi:electron transport complex protein RnfA